MIIKDTIEKVRALVSMKTALIDALRGDLETAAQRITHLEAKIDELESVLRFQHENAWWKTQDEEMSREELKASVELEMSSESEPMTFEEGLDASWEKPKK